MTGRLLQDKPVGLIAASIAVVGGALSLMVRGVFACPIWAVLLAAVLVGTGAAWISSLWSGRRQTLAAIAVLSSGFVAAPIVGVWGFLRDSALTFYAPLSFLVIITPLSCLGLVAKEYRGLASLILLAGLVSFGGMAGYADGVLRKDYTFVGDVTVPDGTLMKPGETFTKTWRLRNCGLRAWRGCSLVHSSGDRMGAPSTVPVSLTRFGQAVDISVEMHAPEADGVYRGDWRVHKADGELLSRWRRVFVEIEVVSGLPKEPQEVLDE